jgi:lipoprotein NlpI
LIYYGKGEYDAAITDFSAAIGADPRYGNAYRNRADAYLKQGDYDRAMLDFLAALAMNAKDSAAYLGRGIAYERMGDYDRAIVDYDSAIAIDPQESAGFTNRGYMHFYRGDFADAAADLARVEGTETYPYPNLFRFLAQTRAGQPFSDLEPAAQRMKSQHGPYAVLELYLGRRDTGATLAAAQKPEERCEAQFYVGEWQLLQGDTTQAKQLFEQAVSGCPKSFVEYKAARAELDRLAP